MHNNDAMDRIRKTINSSNSEFKVDKFKIGSCGYFGNVFYTEGVSKSNDPYKLATELIQNEFIHEVGIIDLSSCSVYNFYRDYDSGIGDKINIETEIFDRYSGLLSQKRNNRNVFLRIYTLAIKEESLKEISKFNTYMELVDCLKYMRAISKPKPNVKVDNADEFEMVALINYHHQDFKIERFVNNGDFYDGYFIEGYVKGDTKKTVQQLVSNSKVVYSGEFIKDNQYHSISENGDCYIVDSIGISEFSNLKETKNHITLHVFLELDALKDIHRMDNSEQVIQYLMIKERSPDPTFDKIQSLDDGEILPF